MSFIRKLAKAVLPPAVTIRLRAAFKHHERERALLPALCDPARIGIDAGAALGAYTWPLSRLCRTCIAFEPNPDQADYLRRALGTTARIENLALSDRSGETELVIPLENGREMAGWASIADVPITGPARRHKVAMRSLDSLMLEPVGFIKVDVEGHELAVLQGAHDLLRRDRPNLLVEVEERFADGIVARVRDYVEQQDYRGLFLDGKRLHPIAEFDPAMHQAIANWGKIGGYINNFVFIPAENYAATRESLSRLGYPAPD